MNTPSRKRTIRDISNTQLPLTPTKTPTKVKRIRLDEFQERSKPTCVKKLTFLLSIQSQIPPLPQRYIPVPRHCFNVVLISIKIQCIYS